MNSRMAMALDATDMSSDEDLLERFATGDQSAARTLTFRHAPRLLALARRMLSDAAEAEDVTQEAMLRMWKIAPAWRKEEAALSTWLYRVTSNLCIDRLRRGRGGRSLDDVPEMTDDAPGPGQLLEARDRTAALETALRALPERQRLAIILRHLEERPNPEIATILDTSVEAVESLLARGRRILAAQLLPRRAELGFGDE